MRKRGILRMKWIAIALVAAVMFAGCGADLNESTVEEKNMYRQITQEEAKKMMDEQEVLIVDVREQAEYDAGHIVGAVLLPLGEIDEESAAQVIPEKETVALVYCRSGRRSKEASEKLVALGYTNIYEFGGIITWPYEVE